MSPKHLRITVASAGVRVQVSATSVKCSKITFAGDPGNTTTEVYVGGADVVAAVGAGRRGIPLHGTTGDYQRMEGRYEVEGSRAEPGGPLDLADWWVDSPVNAKSVLVTYYPL